MVQCTNFAVCCTIDPGITSILAESVILVATQIFARRIMKREGEIDLGSSVGFWVGP
jgi:hypothetical protein